MSGVDLWNRFLTYTSRFLSRDKRLSNRDIYVNLKASPHGATLLSQGTRSQGALGSLRVNFILDFDLYFT
jgi:hypothetical protein